MSKLDRVSSRSIDRIGMIILSVVVAGGYLAAYWLHPFRPRGRGDGGWWTWFDQGWYLSAASAWSRFDLDPTRHHYLPGYPLLAAPFIRLLPLQAFAVPDLLCLLISLWLFSALAIRTLPRMLPCRRLLGGVAFAAVSLGSPSMRDVWVVPWSTTGAVPFVYGALLAAVCFIERPDRVSLVFWIGLAGGCVAGFRPADAVPVMLASGIGCASALILSRAGWRATAGSIVWGMLGLSCAIIMVFVPYLLIYGFHESAYVVSSGLVGFEWRFLGLHWVLLGLDPHPMIDDGFGLVEAFPWLPLGLAGCLICVVAPSRPAGRLIHLTVAVAACLHIALYLCYRDLYPEGFFRYWNYHYYKWIMPVMALYAVILTYELACGPRRVIKATLTVAVLAILLPWRPELGRITPLRTGTSPDPLHTLDFASGLHSIRDVVLVAADGDREAIYGGASALSINGHGYADRADYKLLPAPGGFLLVPLRPLPDGQARLTVGRGVRLDPTAAPLHARQRLVLGLPCWLPWHERRCETPFLLPPPILPASRTIRFDGAETRFLGEGWSVHEPTGRWTDGDAATVRARIATHADMPWQLRMTGSAYLPPESRPLIVRLQIDGQDIATWTFTTGETTTMAAAIPASVVRTSPTIDIRLLIGDPRSPITYAVGSHDDRQLGLFIRTLSLTPKLS